MSDMNKTAHKLIHTILNKGENTMGQSDQDVMGTLKDISLSLNKITKMLDGIAEALNKIDLQKDHRLK